MVFGRVHCRKHRRDGQKESDQGRAEPADYKSEHQREPPFTNALFQHLIAAGPSPVQMQTKLQPHGPAPRLRSLADRLEDVRDDRLIGNAAARCIWLLRPGLGQPIHRFDRAQDVDVCDAFSFGIPPGLYVCPGEDCNDPILNVA
jgi:hypothetical protein